MEIWKDKQIKEIIESLKIKLRKNNVSTKRDHKLSAPRFVFVCGKEFVEGEETIRELVIDELKTYKIHNDYGRENSRVLCVVSEHLYIQDLAEDIFVFEKMLAEISKSIIVVSESAGTFCELGAFLMDKEICKKTIVINEDKEEYRESFITKGPIKMLQEIHDKNVILHSGVQRIKSSTEYIHRMEAIANDELVISINEKAEELILMSLIYEFCNIVELFQPLEEYEIGWIYKEIKGFDTYTIKNTSEHKISTFRKVILLMNRMNVLKKKDGLYYLNEKISCYNVMFNMTRKEYNDIRLKYLNRLEKCQPQRMVV